MLAACGHWSKPKPNLAYSIRAQWEINLDPVNKCYLSRPLAQLLHLARDSKNIIHERLDSKYNARVSSRLDDHKITRGGLNGLLRDVGLTDVGANVFIHLVFFKIADVQRLVKPQAVV